MAFTPHDLRRTARTHRAKLGIVPELARKLLGHAPPRSDVDAVVYDQHLYQGEMNEALKKWERHLMSIVTDAHTGERPHDQAKKNATAEVWHVDAANEERVRR